MWLDLKGAVVADTVYDSGVLTAKDTSFTLPAISQMTADLNAMGTMTVPIALDMYNDERLAHYIIEYNPDYADVIVFEGGVQLKLPVVEEAETSETVPPWRATA